MNGTNEIDIDDFFDRAVIALEHEILTVRERPSSDVLYNGVRQAASPSSDALYDYKFETFQPAIRYAEEIRATNGKKEWKVTPVTYDNNEVILRFPEAAGEKIDELQVEWENDFVLQRTLKEIVWLESAGKKMRNRINRLFEPDDKKLPAGFEISDDGMRNDAQRAAIEKSLKYRTVFIWGPPGTGKTATLGFIIANYLKQGKRVLFASNTNRAVDVGLISSLEALADIGLPVDLEKITRFGEPALDDERIEKVSFDRQIEKILEKRKHEASDWASLLSRQAEIKKAVENHLKDGKQPTQKQNMEIDLIDEKIRDEGGREKLEKKIEELMDLNERLELKKKNLVATTLAKVCTSEHFHDNDFDAVVVDEGSMASLPAMMVLASKAKWHRVIVGDPMQLPPIAMTNDPESREFLEKDIFITVSGAEAAEDLFLWHDQNPAFTCFFDTQYRLEPSLADVISTVFYEGRLKSDKLNNGAGQISDGRGYHLIDTSKYKPVLTKKTGERGFQPVNLVHQEVIERLVGNMLLKGIRPEEIGVMVPFRSSVYDLRSRLYEASIRDIEVGTIHTFQGREKPYIIFDTVMSGELQHGGVRHYSVRPLDEAKNGLSVPRLLNVAFSRSQKELMILADMHHIHKVYGEKFLGRLLERMKK